MSTRSELPLLFSRLARISRNHSGSFFAVLDSDGRVLDFERDKAGLLGLNASQLLGVSASGTLLPTVHEEDWPLVKQDQIKRLFPRTEFYPGGRRTVMWEADYDAATETCLLFGATMGGRFEGTLELEQLTERLRRHDRLLGNLPGMVYRIRRRNGWTMEYVSERSEELTGYQASELLSGSIQYAESVVAPEDRERVAALAEQAMVERRPFTIQYRIVRRDGQMRHVWERGVGVYNADGSVVAREGFVTDMTALFEAQSELESTNRKLRSVLDSATQTAVIMCDRDGVIIEFNRGAELMLGYSADEMVGKETPLRFHDAEEVKARSAELSEQLGRRIEDFETLVALARDGVADRKDWIYMAKNGRRFQVELVVTVVTDSSGAIVGSLGIAEDVSDRRQAEIALQEAKERAESLNRAKDEFLAVMSHEMRTPLNPILGFSDLLLRRDLDADTADSLQIINRSARKLLRQIEDILDFVRIEKGKTKIERKPERLWTFCQHVAKDLEPRSGSNAFRLENGCGERAVPISSDWTASFDADLLGQVLSNLLVNAFKFTRNGTVTLRVGLANGSRLSPRARFEVEDTGIGIGVEKRKSVFQPFTQVESNYTRRYEGVGLGLAICSKIVDLLDGEIGCESEEGKGSLFWIELPLPLEASAPGVDIDGDSSGLPQLSRPIDVLVAEDNHDNMAMIVMYLKAMGARVTGVADGRSAVAECSKKNYDAVLLDISMPGMDGFETAVRLFSHCDNAHRPPLIALTAHADRETRQRCFDCGMTDFATKPIGYTDLWSLLERHALADRAEAI